MGIFEVISAIVLIIACVFIVAVILIKETKTQMSQTISGTTADSFYQKNAGRTKEAMLNKATIVAAIIFFALAIAVNVLNVYGNKAAAGDTSTPAAVTSSDTASEPDDTSETDETSDDTSAATSDTSDATSDGASDTE